MKRPKKRLALLLLLLLLLLGTAAQAALTYARKFRVVYLLRNGDTTMPMKEYIQTSGEDGFTIVYDRTWILKEGGSAFYDILKREWFVDENGVEYTIVYRTWQEYSDFDFQTTYGRTADGCSGQEAFEWARSILGFDAGRVYSILCTAYLEPSGAVYSDHTALTIRCEDSEGNELFYEEQTLTPSKGLDFSLTESPVEGYSLRFAVLTTQDIWGEVSGKKLSGDSVRLRFDQGVKQFELLCVLDPLPPEETEAAPETDESTGELTEPADTEAAETPESSSEPETAAEESTGETAGPPEESEAETSAAAAAQEATTAPAVPSERQESSLKNSPFYRPLLIGGGAGALFIAASLLILGGKRKH